MLGQVQSYLTPAGKNMGEAKRKRLIGWQGPVVAIDRLVIIEWLKPTDEKTGAKLREYLQERNPGLPVQLIQCESTEQVFSAFDRLLIDVKDGARPIVHVESHGSPTGISGMSPLQGNPNAMDDIPWSELSDLMRPINLASDFNLILVSAACFGAHAGKMVIEDVEGSTFFKPVPFVLALGYSGPILATDVLKSMSALYDHLLNDRAPMLDAVAHAKEQLDDDHLLHIESLPNALRRAGKSLQTLYRELGSEPAYQRINIYRAFKGRKPIPHAMINRERRNVISKAYDHIAGQLLDYENFPNNRSRFKLEGKYFARDGDIRLPG